MKLFHKILLVVSLSLFSTACTDFAEINTNPNAPTAVGGDLLLPTIIIDPAQRMGRVAWEQGNTASQISAVNNFTTFDQMGWGTFNSVWNDMYVSIRNAELLIEIGQETNNDAYIAVATIMRAWMGATLTDFFGDVPFSTANEAKDGNFTPVYDQQQNIYAQVLSDLEAASNTLANGGNIGGDLLFSGDLTKWRKFANSLRIRYLMRQELKLGGSTIGTQIQQIIDNEPIFESIDDDASIPYLATAPNQYFQHTGRVGGFDEHRMSKKAEDRMKSINDPRLFVFYRPIGNEDSLATYIDAADLANIQANAGTGKTAFKDFFTNVYTSNPDDMAQYFPLFKGLVNGLSESNAINFNGSRQNQSRLGEILRELPNGVAMHFMTYSELQFILAEAATKGYISGDANTYYTSGMNAAFAMYSITPADSYFTQADVALSAESGRALEQIALQKWMSLFVNGMEAYFDWRRTGMPEVTPGPDNVNENRVPLRFVYPGAEQAQNEANWQAAVDRLGGDDDINARIWVLTN